MTITNGAIGGRVKLVDGNLTLLDCAGEVASYQLERGVDGLHIKMHIPDPVPIDVIKASAVSVASTMMTTERAGKIVRRWFRLKR